MTTSGSGALLPSSQIVNQGNPYINGMRLTYLTTTTFSVGAGQVRDQSNTTDILMGNTLLPGSGSGDTNSFGNSAAVTISISKNGVGGLDVGTVAASTEYSVFAIGNSTGFLNGSAVVSLAAPTVGPTLPSATASNGLTYSYDCWRYIGSISVDGSSHIRKFTQTGAQALRTVWYDPGTGPSTAGVVIPSSATSSSTTYINAGVFTSLIPQTALEVILDVAFTPNSAGNVVYFAPATIDNGTTATLGSMAALGAEVTGHAQTGVVRVPVSLPNAAQIAALTIGNVVTALVASTSASDSMVLLLNGYVDQL